MKWIKRIGITLFLLSYLFLLYTVYNHNAQHWTIYEGEIEIYRDMCKGVNL